MQWFHDIKQLNSINKRRAYFPTTIAEADLRPGGCCNFKFKNILK